MKNLITALLIVVLSFVSCKKEEKTETEPKIVSDSIKTKETVAEVVVDSATEVKAWQDYEKPGEQHKWMAEGAGTWNCEMTFWYEPNGKPEKASSVANIQMILGGRYQQTSFKGKIMEAPFEGMDILAYNNASKEYTSTFIDNMGTGIMIGTGSYDEKTKTLSLKGNTVNPATGKKGPYREVRTTIDDKTKKIEMFDVKNGEEFKSMEINMTRK